MQNLLTELESALQSQTPAMTAAWADPATEEAIREAEAALDVSFPDDLRAFLLSADGQTVADYAPVGNFIVPRMPFAPDVSDLSAWGYFLSLSQIVEQTQYYREIAEESGDDEGRQYFGPVAAHHQHILITSSDDPVSIGLDLQPAEGGHVGQVVTINDQPDHTAVLAPSLSAFLQRLVDGYRARRFRREEDGTMTEGGTD